MAIFSNLLKGQEPDLVIQIFFFSGKAKLIMWVFVVVVFLNETLKVCIMVKNVTNLTFTLLSYSSGWPLVLCGSQ